MNTEEKNEIYKTWKALEQECALRVHQVVPGKKIESQYLSIPKFEQLGKYRKWALKYCFELLDPSEKHELYLYISEPITCECVETQCAKCLLVNCQDDDCYFHSKESKADFKKRYNK